MLDTLGRTAIFTPCVVNELILRIVTARSAEKVKPGENRNDRPRAFINKSFTSWSKNQTVIVQGSTTLFKKKKKFYLFIVK